MLWQQLHGNPAVYMHDAWQQLHGNPSVYVYNINDALGITAWQPKCLYI